MEGKFSKVKDVSAVQAFKLCKSSISFDELVDGFLHSAVGKRSYTRCKDDIKCMKESCAIVEKASSRLTLKVCILVLMLLLTMQVLMTANEDASMVQGLY